jgi:ABC-type transport system substrate-binding protein
MLRGAVAGALAFPALRSLGGNQTDVLRSLLGEGAKARAGEVSKRSGTLQVANLAEPNFIDPAYALEVEEFAVVRSVYDGLLQWNTTQSQLVAALAESWTSNSNATEWTFKLRPNVTFQDGTPFNSSAMKATFSHYLPGSWGFLLSSMTTLDDSDPLVLKVSFSAPNPDFGRNLTFIKAMSPLQIQKKTSAKQAVGTGAFQWGEWVHGEKITLAASSSYWGTPEPYLDGIDLITVTDETARVNGLESGSLNLIMRVDPHDLPSLASNAKVGLSGGPSWLELHLTFRCDQPITSNLLVRQAIAYGVDRDTIVKDVLLGQGTVAPSPIPIGCYGHITPTTSYSYDPDKSRALLKAAGYSKGLTLKMGTGSPDYALVGEAMVAQLSSAGINVIFDVEDPGVLVADLGATKPKHDLFILTYGWVNGGPFHFDTGLVLAHPQYKGRALTELVHECNTTPDGPKRLSYLAQAQDLFMQQIPHLPLYYANNTDAFSSTVHGYVYPKDAYQPVFANTSFS